MADVIQLTIPGQPIAKGRPRMARNGRPYTPAKTRQYEAYVRALALHDIGRIQLEGPLEVTILASFRIPPSWPKSRREAAWAGTVHHTTKPDADNMKSVIDALNGVLWLDDCQIVRLYVEKLYTTVPSVTVTVREL